LNSGKVRAGTSGEILAQAGAAREEILIVPVDLASVDTARTTGPSCVTGGLMLTAAYQTFD